MKPITVLNSNVTLVIQDEIRRSEEARYDHRLHVILLIVNGMTCPQISKLFGDAERTVRHWVHRFNEDGLVGLVDLDHPGRPCRLTEENLKRINEVLRKTPEDFGLIGHLWDGKTLAVFVQKKFKVDLSVRQCQRIFKHLGFRLRKPRGLLARADPERQDDCKKNSKN